MVFVSPVPAESICLEMTCKERLKPCDQSLIETCGSVIGPSLAVQDDIGFGLRHFSQAGLRLTALAAYP